MQRGAPMRIAVRSLKRFLIIAGIVAGLLAVAIPALADYLGPDRAVSTWTMERLVCDYQAVYDPPGVGWYGCTLTLYETPDGACDSPGSVAGYFTSSACGWPAGVNCNTVDCDITGSSSTEGCNDGEPGCRAVEHFVDQPPATVSGSVSCGAAGSGDWCRGDGELSISGSEPLSGYTILALEGTRNGEPFACSGAACDVPLLEGSNDFTFWAVSSWGDTSLMGSASRSLDSQDPSLSGSASGTTGDNGWYVSSVTVSANASDAAPGSGLASLDVRIDGGGWSSYSGPFTIGEGSHDVELRAVDGAGNSETQSLGVDVDTQSPIADLDASPSFCPGCGESLDITVVAQDGGSGIAAWSLTAGGVSVASGSGAIGQTISWDGGGLGGGMHTLELEGRDEAGNTSDASFDFGLIAPTPAPQDDSTDDTGAGSRPKLPPSPTASPIPTRTPRATPTASTVNFGGPSTPLGAGLPVAPADDSAGDSIANLQSPISDRPSGSSSALVPPSGAVFGAAALALAGVATAIALETSRRRKEEEAWVRAEMERRNAEAEAAEAARKAAVAAARAQAEFELTMGQILNQATGGQAPSEEWLASREATLEPHVLPPSQRQPPDTPAATFDIARWRQQENAAAESWAEQQQARQREEAYQAYREGERMSPQAQPPQAEIVPVPGFFSNPLGWFQGTLINAGRRNETVRNALTATMAPAADSLRSIADPERNPQTAAFRAQTLDMVQQSAEGWETAAEGLAALTAYTADAVRDGRREDVARAALAWNQAGRETSAATAVSTLKGIGIVAWGVITTPYRLVTQSIPNFARAVSERQQGGDRTWDVLFTGAMLEGDIAGTYAIARPTGIVDRINASLEQRIFGSPNWGMAVELPAEFQPPGVTGQWQNWDLPSGVTTLEQAYGWQAISRIGQWAPNRALDAIPGPMLPAEQIVTVPAEDLNSLPLGSQGDGQTVLLWTADNRGVNFVPEQTSWPTSRTSRLNPDMTTVSHTNLSRGAYSGGEAWRTAEGQLTITPASGAYGYNRDLPASLLAEGGVRYNAVVEFLRSLGLDVTAVPFGPR